MTASALVPLIKSRAGAEQRLTALEEIERHVRDRLATYAPNTQRALKADWTIWYAWCVEGRNHHDGQPKKAFPITSAVLIEFIKAHSPGEVRGRRRHTKSRRAIDARSRQIGADNRSVSGVAAGVASAGGI
jgi:hypothetical protein